MRALILVAALCFICCVADDSCQGTGGNYPNSPACTTACDVSCGCVPSSGGSYNCEDVVSKLAGWIIAVLIVGTLIVISPCIICCIGICCCGWFGLRAANRRPVQQVVYAQPVYAQAPPSISIQTTGVPPPTQPAYGYGGPPPPMATEANKWQ
uniref:Uncharacterized protein n=1 Tax=Plectus sambesii TaxID=2011161 RepID=A0A914V5W7_9BILA